MTHGNGVVSSYTYDPASQLLSLTHKLGATTIDSFSYTYDKVGNRKTKVDTNGSYKIWIWLDLLDLGWIWGQELDLGSDITFTSLLTAKRSVW